VDSFSHIPKIHIPSFGTRAYQLLLILSDGLPHTTRELTIALGSDPRSPLQALRGEVYGFWLIHNLGDSIGNYVLDSRHLSGDIKQDFEARQIAEITLRERSREIAERESYRLANAKALEETAKAERQLTLILPIPKKHPP